ncbi:hypothetical protein OMP38_01570 [Cohnella ginsengisoli]|uniref:Nucleotidyltransferase family protein n=1 Tax=Cohnella ginsengisoli TaxID=425004 RepID=A0A9X4QL16_9BACL|nr:hypothetical protein [Cohnella ginsengisoli]MDG0789681.1 hypothetical protein [Cohnella ginsengisoli]
MPMEVAGAGESILRALSAFAALTGDCDARWVVGGSAGLALRGARLASAPRDLDIYADAAAAAALHERAAGWASDGPAWDETGSYRSLLSHYRYGGVTIELVGDFEVQVPGSRYRTEVDAFLYAHGDDWMPYDGARPIRLMPLGHELIFNLLRERRDRALEAARLIRLEPETHLPALQRLAARQSLSGDIRRELRRLTAAEPEEGADDGR